MLDLLDYCYRSITRLLVNSEDGEEKKKTTKMVDSEESSEEDSDGDEHTPSKRKILQVCVAYLCRVGWGGGSFGWNDTFL